MIDVLRQAVHGRETWAVPEVGRALSEATRRLAQVRGRGGPYREVEFSGAIGDLLVRFDTGRVLAGRVH